MAVAAEPISVLIVDSDPVQRRLLAAHIDGRADRRFRSRIYETSREAAAAARAAPGAVQIVIADVDSIGGTEPLSELARAGGPVIALSARGSLTTAVAAMRAGAADYLPKPIGPHALLERVEAALTAWRAAQATDRARPAAVQSAPDRTGANAAGSDFEGFIGRSVPMLAVYEQIARIAPSRAPVFITGESGTGKEVCAEAIHARGGRDRPFVAINCGAIPKDLMESEVFGHVRGAFTGAVDSRPGAAELAHGGTLFLDEIGEMAMGLQAKLLRFIQTGTVRRVGDVEARQVDVRFVCATNRDAETEMRAGRFREDLFYRLSVLPVTLPSLRARPEDILPLAEAFLARFSAEEGRKFVGFAPGVAERFTRYAWPGNVRQLQNVIRRIVVLNDEIAITEAMLPAEMDPGAGNPQGAAEAAKPAPTRANVRPFHEQEKQIIEDALAAFGGNINRAAAALQINPSTIYRKRLAWQGEAQA